MKENEPLVLTSQQLTTLSSVLRSEIYQAFLELERATVSEIAEKLRKPAKSLYFHVRQMESVGLLHVAERRKAAKREEAIYAPASSQVMIDRKNAAPEYRKSVISKISTTLRQADREHQRAVEAVIERPELNDYIRTYRISAVLAPQDAKELGEKLKELAAWIRSKGAAEGIPIALTALVAPTDLNKRK